MSTRIPYLDELEVDLTRAAAAAAETRDGGRRRRPTTGAWLRWSGAAAAILVLAWGIGTVLNPSGGDDRATSPFNQVGTAVGGAGSTGDGARVPNEVPAASPAVVSNGLSSGEDASRDDAQTEAWSFDAFGQGGSDTSGSPQASSTAPRIDLAKIDRDGSLTLKIDDVSQTFIRVIEITEGAGGMLLSSETVGDGAAHLTLRIPAGRFDKAFAEISQLGEVRASAITGKDVTADYIDYQAQLKILKSRREVIFDLYDQATGIPQVLQLENELNRVQLDIDRIQGQLNYLDAQTSISTLKVSLSETEPEIAQVVEGDDRPSLGNAVSSGVDGFLGVLSAMIVGLGYLIPVAVLVLLVFGIVTLVRRRDRGAS